MQQPSLVKQLVTAILLIAIGGVVGFQIGHRNVLTATGVDIQALLSKTDQPAQYKNVDFSQFWDVWSILDKNYLDPTKLDPKKQVYGAIEGMTNSLGDPYTLYLPPTEQKRSSEDLAGSFFGVGIQLGYKDKTLAVIAPLKGTPAEKVDVKSGDLILHLKDSTKNLDVDTIDMSLEDAVDKIRGQKGVPITLTLAREGVAKPFDVAIPRGEIVVPSVELTYAEKNGKRAAVIHLSRFGGQTDDEWNTIVNEIIKQKNLSGVILDMRNNPGGYLDGAVNLASEFIKEGLIVSQEGREKTQKYTVNRVGQLTEIPIEVLINKGSASASEILAGALRDRRNAKLFGENSFGKGTVQDAMELPGGAGLHVTIGRWLLPNGDWIHGKGIAPTETVTDDPNTPNDEVVDKALDSF
ncbi:MAG: S41 family peptidase [Patescibacteria group bacterium]